MTSQQDVAASNALQRPADLAERIRVRGLVQGVGFRPTVWRLANAAGLSGDVRNDAEGVLIRLWAPRLEIDTFCRTLMAECPPLGRIDRIERQPFSEPAPKGFRIIESAGGTIRTGVVSDAATCPACLAELLTPSDRRFQYPFTNCTHCGPRLSIVRAIPYDRANTSMASFEMCPSCAKEYRDPADRRFHAQPNACPVCGPRVWLVHALEHAPAPIVADAQLESAVGPADPGSWIAQAVQLLETGSILAIKGIGGFHLACDATNSEAVDRLRRRKRRAAKPFALMARDLEVVGRFCALSPAEAELLSSAAAPIVLLERQPGPATDVPQIAEQVAPGQPGLGVMLPYSPLHHLLLQHWERPLVMTSGNLSDEPQCIDNDDALARLGGIADAWLLHDREIINRVDDSVARVVRGRPRWLRRARGAAPTPLALPEGLAAAPPVLALGGELKNTVCLLGGGQATLSQHLGDLEEARTAREFERTLALYRTLFEHRPERIAVDLHPDYRSSEVGRRLAEATGARLVEVQHHAAHLGSVLADAQWPVEAGPVVGLVLDGLGYGSDGRIWGGELLFGDYRQCSRLGCLRPFPLPGGERAIREPWRCLYAQLVATYGPPDGARYWQQAERLPALRGKPLELLGEMISRGLNAPETSSAGRLFDAVAAALGICADGIAYEAQAAIELETLARGAGDEPGYPFRLRTRCAPWQLDPTPMWQALLADLAAGVAPARIAARFHQGFAEALAEFAAAAAAEQGADRVALSGGVFQNRTLFEAVTAALRERELEALTHTRVPANDGGLSLGQAVIAALA